MHTFLRSRPVHLHQPRASPLLNFEWLSELPYYFAFQAWGLQRYCSPVYLVDAVARLCRGVLPGPAAGRQPRATRALVSMAGVALGCYSIGPQMHHFGWLCLMHRSCSCWSVFSETGKGLWALPLLFAVWINLHASWVFGFVVMGSVYRLGSGRRPAGTYVAAERWTPAQLRKLLLAYRRVGGCAVGQPLWLQTGVVPL